MKTPVIEKSEVMNRLLQAFRQYGYAGTSLSELSARTNLGKASLYHYFPGGKEEMGKMVLEYVSAWLEKEIFSILKNQALSPQKKIDAMFDYLNEFYCEGKNGCVLGIFSLGESKDLFQSKLKAIFQEWINLLSDTLTSGKISIGDARKRAEDALLKMQGALILSAALDDQRVFARTVKEIKTEILNPERPHS